MLGCSWSNMNVRIGKFYIIKTILIIHMISSKNCVRILYSGTSADANVVAVLIIRFSKSSKVFLSLDGVGVVPSDTLFLLLLVVLELGMFSFRFCEADTGQIVL